MKRPIFLVGVLIIWVSGSAKADTIYHNFTTISGTGSAVSGPASGFPGGSTYESANAFKPVGSSYFFTELEVALTYFGGDDSVSVDLVSDSGGAPGAILESWIVDDLPFGGGLQQLFGNGTIALTAGTQYWVVAAPNGTDTAAGWSQGSPSFLGVIGTNRGSGWEVVAGSAQGALDVQGTVASPEPGTIALIGIGIFGLGMVSACRGFVSRVVSS